MACSVLFTDEAERDEGRIVAYLLHDLDSPQAAAHFLNELDEAVGLLASAPDSYPKCAEERLAVLGYRKIPVMNYIALYRMVDDSAVVAHIFHQTQDYARLV